MHRGSAATHSLPRALCAEDPGCTLFPHCHSADALMGRERASSRVGRHGAFVGRAHAIVAQITGPQTLAGTSAWATLVGGRGMDVGAGKLGQWGARKPAEVVSDDSCFLCSRARHFSHPTSEPCQVVLQGARPLSSSNSPVHALQCMGSQPACFRALRCCVDSLLHHAFTGRS